MSMVFMSVLPLEVEEPSGRRLDPLHLRILVEHEPLVGGGDAPGARAHLRVEVPPRPPGGPPAEQRSPRAAAPGPRHPHPWGLAEREVRVDHEGTPAGPVRGVKD